MSYIDIKLVKNNSLYLIIVLPLFLISCATTNSNLKTSVGDTSKYETLSIESMSAFYPGVKSVQMPIKDLSMLVKSNEAWVIMDPPLRSPKITFFDNSPKNPIERKIVTKHWAELEHKQIMELLSNTRAEISVSKVESNGTITYLPGTLTRDKGNYKVIMDYTAYIVDDVIDSSYTEFSTAIGLSTKPHKIGDVRVGVGLRLTANITTNKNNVNLGGLIPLGLAAKSNKVQGYMHVDTIGIRLKGNSGIILSNTTIDESSILKTVETLAIMQSRIADETTHLDPQVIWVKPISAQFSPDMVAGQKNN
ncbi:hypothetical protein QL898_13540 [Psychrobacter sp. APC 3279]|uniref:hypothetical protein n=1 Tax=Psychrobacter sp. APC 3279 TaxID=3035189 RepID=UPI0025B45E12|nr:hypothetical protein [Psychrobacter sp. APC 3279]MDN3442650.1 hypothetical protein [Psychrobacter sp. APC 3279]